MLRSFPPNFHSIKRRKGQLSTGVPTQVWWDEGGEGDTKILFQRTKQEWEEDESQRAPYSASFGGLVGGRQTFALFKKAKRTIDPLSPLPRMP